VNVNISKQENMNADSKEELNNTEFDMKLQQFHEAAFKIQDMIKLVNNPELYDKLSNADKIKYNFLLSYSLNSIFWMYLRAEGILQFLKHSTENYLYNVPSY